MKFQNQQQGWLSEIQFCETRNLSNGQVRYVGASKQGYILTFLANDLSSSQSSQIKRVCTRVRLTILQLLLSDQFERYNKNDWDGNVLSAQVKNGKKIFDKA